MRSLTRRTRGGRGGMLELRDGIRKSDKLLITLSQICIQLTTSWLVHIQKHLGARTSLGDGTSTHVYKPLDLNVWPKSRNGMKIHCPNTFKLSSLQENKWEVG